MLRYFCSARRRASSVSSFFLTWSFITSVTMGIVASRDQQVPGRDLIKRCTLWNWLSVGSCQLSVVSCQLSVVSCQLSVVSGQWAVGSGEERCLVLLLLLVY